MIVSRIRQTIGLGLCLALILLGVYFTLTHKNTGKLGFLASGKVVDWRQSTTVTIAF